MKRNPEQGGGNGLKPPNGTETCLMDKSFHLAKPLVVSMSLFGLLFFKSEKGILSRITRAYSLFVLLVFAVSFIQLFFAYRDEELGGRPLIKVVLHLWYLHNCVNAAVTYRACSNDNRFVQFLLQWSKLLGTNRGISPHESDFSTSNYERKIKRRFKLFVTIGWSVMILNITYELYFLFNTNLVDFAIAPMLPNHSYAVLMKAIVAVVQLYMTAAWVFPITVFTMMSDAIYNEFEIFHDDLQKAISPEGDLLELEWFRRRHEEICQMVETADDILSAFIAAGIFFCTCEGMLLLYTTVTSPNALTEPLVLLSHCFWLTVKALYLLLISYGGGYLNHMVSLNIHLLQRT